jgi:hypothetical protein
LSRVSACHRSIMGVVLQRGAGWFAGRQSVWLTKK